MILKPLKLRHKTILVALEGLMVLLVLGALTLGVLIYRVSQGPIETERPIAQCRPENRRGSSVLGDG